MQINRAEIGALLPHADDMCLLDGVLEWNENRIYCITATHRSAENPLRRLGLLHAICAIEYVSQTMAVHGALIDRKKRRANQGYLASIRDFNSAVARLDDIANDLVIEARLLLNMDQRALYEFSVAAGGQQLMSGRVAAALLGGAL